MSKRPRNKIDRKSAKIAAAKRNPQALPLLLLAAAIFVFIGLVLWWRQSLSISSLVKPVNSAATARNTEFQRLKGRWRRPDGGYIMAINNINDAGTMDAAYFNPYSIHIGNAAASRDGDVMKVFVELRDVNYPGSTYTLTYEPSIDQLKGIYYQAVEQQRFQVVFERIQ